MISVICPTYNEFEFIRDLVDSIDQMLPHKKEIIIIDGMSNDGTREILEKFEKEGKIKFFSNPDRTVPYALNIGIKNASGDIISRIDAHSKYADDYFEQIISTFNEVDADIVGGPTRVDFKNDSQKAIGIAISSSFGIGNSLVHQEDYRGYSDSVTFGSWKKNIFEKTGLFDESLKRNQDDEFHYRAKSLGFKIYQEPNIKLWYYPRSRLNTLFKQYFEYGFYKPLVLLKIGSEAKIRHLVPSFFVFYLASILPLLFLNAVIFLPLIVYLIIDLVLVFNQKNLNFKTRFILLLSFPTIHISYGSGFILGFLNRFIK